MTETTNKKRGRKSMFTTLRIESVQSNVTFSLKQYSRREQSSRREDETSHKDLVDQPGSKNTMTFHFNASDECAKLLSDFARIHREAKNKIFRRAWDEWILLPDVSPILEKETSALLEAGYKGDPLEKMYSSARYYYRKKALKEENQAEELREATPRKQYELSDARLLDQISNHIIELFHTDNISPAKAFEMYANKYQDNPSDAKLKKIYKNRFFLLRAKMLKAT